MFSGQHRFLTPHGLLTVEETRRSGLPVLLIHGNSSSRHVFRGQMTGELARNFRLIALDLPGHGDSSDALDPAQTYTRPGLADAAIAVLRTLGIVEAVVFGWSLGGHIAIEMAARFPEIRGLMISGTPPVGRDNMAQGFKASSHGALAGKEELSDTEIDSFVHAIYGGVVDPLLRHAAARADGRFRKRVFEGARAGLGADQRHFVETSPIPLAVVNGAVDPLVNLDYIDSLAYANLWDGRCHRLAGLGHAPFWQAPELFNPILERFLRDIERSRT